MVIKNGDIFIQAGAGIVADSDPDAEYEETVNKAKGMMHAIKLAASGLKIK
jgi:anthranilate synthase component 1